MFGTNPSGFGTTNTTMFGSTTGVGNHNPMKDFEVVYPPDDSISSLAFSPQQNFLIAASWDNQVRNTRVFTL